MVMIWISQYLSIMGFSFAMPFVPFFLQKDLGVTSPAELKMWVALFTSVMAFSMAIAAPVWGILADRFGKRVMLLRANFAGALVLSCMGLVTAPIWLIVLRFIQGVFTGTMTASQAMIASQVPKQHTGLALGGLSSAVFSGSMTGALLGGYVAHWVGYREAFWVSGLLLLVGALLILFGTKEISPAASSPSPSATSDEKTAQPAVSRRDVVTYIWPMLLLILAVGFTRQFDMSFIPLLVQEIHGSLEGASVWSGLLMAFGGLAGILSGILVGWLSDRVPSERLLLVAVLLAGLFTGCQILTQSFLMLFVIRFLTVFFAGSLEPVINSCLAKSTPREHQGAIFGLASTARQIGFAPSALLAGAVATIHLRAVFGVGALLFVLLSGLVLTLWRCGDFPAKPCKTPPEPR